MSIFDYRKSKQQILETLNSKTEIVVTKGIPNSEKFNYDNGVRTWVASLFVDIVDSTSYFQSNAISDNMLSRIIRSFTEQIVSILEANEFKYEIGIRGDCVYGIFHASYTSNLLEIFRTAYRINTFIKMFNAILSDYSLPNIYAGIGLGCGNDLIIKAGDRGYNDKIWIGDAVFNASNLSKIANRNGLSPICMDSTFYSNVIELLKKENPNYSSWVRKGYSSRFNYNFYECDIVQTNFNNWIDNGMK